MSGPIRTAIVIACLAVAPLLVTAAGFAIGSVAWDFHHELYPQAKLMLDGRNPYPQGPFEPLAGTNYVWPPAAIALVTPFTALPTSVADPLFAVLGLGCMGLSLWLVGLRDWRVFGVAALWQPILIEPGLAHLTPVLMLLAALSWRTRRARYAGGLFVGLAIGVKFFVWPLAIWLASGGRKLGALVAALIACVSVLPVLAFTALGTYVDALNRVSSAYDQDSYTVFGLVEQAGGPAALGRALTLVFSAALVWGTWRYRSFTLAIAAALVFSPIVWLDYFALAAVPLAITKPRLSAVWFVPLATAGAQGAGWQIGDVLDTARVLCAFAIVLLIAFRAERALADGAPRWAQPFGLASVPGHPTPCPNRTSDGGWTYVQSRRSVASRP